jgi:trans-aconitate methyltransferase
MWDAALYLRFGGERSRPFFDLLARSELNFPDTWSTWAAAQET